MKKIIPLLVFIGATTAFAALPKPNFICTGKESGLRYDVYFKSFNEIHIFEEDGTERPYQDNVDVQLDIGETFPRTYTYTFTHTEGDELMWVSQFGKQTTFAGFGDEGSCVVP